MPMRASRRSTRARRSPSRASSPSIPGRTCRAGSTAPRCTRTIWSIPTTPTCSTTSPASSASGSPRWSARARRRPRPACARCVVDYEILPTVFDPVAAMEPGAPMLHDKRRGRHRQRQHLLHPAGRDRRRGAGLQGSRRRARARPTRPRACSTSISRRTARSPTRARMAAGTSAPARRARSPPAAKLAYLMGVPATRDPCLHRARRRRLRRQAGDGVGGPAAVRQHEARRPTREMGMDPRGRVHRRHDAAPDDHQGQDRRQEGRHADSARRPGGLQHRRLRQPCQRDPGRGDGEPDRGLSLRQQEGHRPRRLHQHDSGRRLPRLRRLADHLRHGMRHRRAGADCSASTRSRCGARTSCGRATTSNRSGRSRATRASAATASTSASTSSSAS